MKRLIILVFCFPLVLFSQIGGTSSYNSLNLNSSSRVLAMGGEVISVMDNDVSLANINPSLMNLGMSGQMSFNFVDYVSDINFISFHISKKIGENFFLFTGIDAVNYGKFENTDEIGNYLGEFSAHEQVFTIGGAKYLGNNFTLGSNIKILNSQLETYHSLAISSNIGVTYNLTEKHFTTSFLLKNIGSPITYYSSEKENLPFEVQLGVSKSLKHLPFRYSLVFHHLNIYDLSNDFYPNTIYNPETNEVEIKEETVAKKMLRHLIIGGELNPFKKNFYLRGGFNFQRREDLKLSTRNSMVGFSFGLGFKISKFYFNYSRSAFHTSSMLNSFSIVTNLSTFGL